MRAFCPPQPGIIHGQPAVSRAPAGVAARWRKRHPGHVHQAEQGGSYEGQQALVGTQSSGAGASLISEVVCQHPVTSVVVLFPDEPVNDAAHTFVSGPLR
jgi:hypothetical protein